MSSKEMWISIDAVVDEVGPSVKVRPLRNVEPEVGPYFAKRHGNGTKTR